jgi:hypothetical protein
MLCAKYHRYTLRAKYHRYTLRAKKQREMSLLFYMPLVNEEKS